VAAFEKSRKRRRQLSIQERIRKVLLDLQGTAELPGLLGELGLMVEDVAVTARRQAATGPYLARP